MTGKVCGESITCSQAVTRGLVEEGVIIGTLLASAMGAIASERLEATSPSTMATLSWETILIDGPVPSPPTKKALEAARLVGGDTAADQLMKAWRRKRYFAYGVDDDDD